MSYLPKKSEPVEKKEPEKPAVVEEVNKPVVEKVQETPSPTYQEQPPQEKVINVPLGMSYLVRAYGADEKNNPHIVDTVRQETMHLKYGLYVWKGKPAQGTKNDMLYAVSSNEEIKYKQPENTQGPEKINIPATMLKLQENLVNLEQEGFPSGYGRPVRIASFTRKDGASSELQKR